jgi:hypothetical protein
VLDSDQAALQAALRANWNVNEENARIIRIFSTLHLEHLYVSEAVYEEIRSLPHITAESGPEPLRFDDQGHHLPFWRER